MTILLHLYNWTRLVWFVYRQKWVKVEPFFKPFLTIFTFELTHNIVAYIFQVIQIEQYPLLARELSSIELACSGEATSQPQTELCCLSQTEDNNYMCILNARICLSLDENSLRGQNNVCNHFWCTFSQFNCAFHTKIWTLMYKEF